MVGVIRFERTTSPSRTVRATKLRHTPTTGHILVKYKVKNLSSDRLFTWSGRQDSNLRPRGPKPRALPTALLPGNSQHARRTEMIVTDTSCLA